MFFIARLDKEHFHTFLINFQIINNILYLIYSHKITISNHSPPKLPLKHKSLPIWSSITNPNIIYRPRQEPIQSTSILIILHHQCLYISLISVNSFRPSSPTINLQLLLAIFPIFILTNFIPTLILNFHVNYF